MSIRLKSYVVLAVISFLTFGNMLGGEYCYDDILIIAERTALDSADSIPKLFTKEFGPTFGELSYRPITSASYFIDSLLFGKTPFYSRLINLLLHLTTACMLLALWRRLFRCDRLALLASLLFLVHPIVTETVNAPGFREEIIMTFFLITSLRWILTSLSTESRINPMAVASGAAALWLMGLLSKEPAVLLLGFAPLLILYSKEIRQSFRQNPKQVQRRAVSLVCGLFIALTLFLILYRTLSYSAPTESVWAGYEGPVNGFLNACRGFLLYARLWIFPVQLSIGHAFDPVSGLSDLRLWGALAVFATFGLAVLVLAWRSRYSENSNTDASCVGLFWALIALAPLTQILPTPQLVAERYMYLPHVGLSLALAAALNALWNKRAEAGKALSAIILLTLIVLTINRNQDWQDNVTLNIRRYELWNNLEGKIALGALYFGEQDFQASEKYGLQAIAIDPNSSEAQRNLGITYFMQSQTDQARIHIEKAFALEPQNPKNRQAMEYLNAAK